MRMRYHYQLSNDGKCNKWRNCVVPYQPKIIIINSVLIYIHLVSYLELGLLVKFINISYTSMLIFNEISCTVKWDEAKKVCNDFYIVYVALLYIHNYTNFYKEMLQHLTPKNNVECCFIGKLLKDYIW